MWYWVVSYKDFAGEWVATLRTHDVFRAMDRWDWWQRYGHAAKLEAFRSVDPKPDFDQGIPDESVSGVRKERSRPRGLQKKRA